MALIGTLIDFSQNTLIKSSEVDANFAAIRDAFNASAVLTDVARTITVPVVVQPSTVVDAVTVVPAIGALGIFVNSPAQTTSQPILQANQTWNAGGVAFDLIRLVVTDTASDAGSNFIDCLVGADLRFAVRKNGDVLAKGFFLDQTQYRSVLSVNRTVIDVGTGGATVETTLQNPTVIGGVMGTNGTLRCQFMFAVSGSAGNKTVRFKFGGTTLLTLVLTAGQTLSKGLAVLLISNKNATNVQLIKGWYTDATGALQAMTDVAGGIDTTANQAVAITGETPNAADEVTAQVTTVELVP